jgi:hypothetical protein
VLIFRKSQFTPLLGIVILSGIYSPQPPIQLLGQVAVDGHVTQPLGFWRFRPLELCLHVAPDSPVRLWWLLWLLRALFFTVHVAGDRWSRPLRWLAVAPLVHRAVWWHTGQSGELWRSGASETRRWQVWSRTTLGTGHCPVAHRTVRCTKPGFSSVSFCSFLLNPNLIFLLVCVWTFSTCRIYNLEQTS